MTETLPAATAEPPSEEVLPALLTPTVVVLPGLLGPLEVSGPDVAAVEAAAAQSLPLALFWRGRVEQARPEDAPEIGVTARVARLVRLPNGDIRVVIQGAARVRRVGVVATDPALWLRVRTLEVRRSPLEGNPLREAVLNSFRAVAALSPTIPEEAAVAAANQTDAGELADVVAGVLELSPEDRQAVLETLDPIARLELVLQLSERKRSMLEVAQQIQRQATERAGEQQREYLLREQMKAIQRELGDLDPEQAEVAELRRRLETAELPPEVRTEVERELARLERLNPASPEYAIVRTRLDWILSLPWGEPPPSTIDLDEARRVLDADHYGLDRVKDRIIDHLAVVALRGGARGPILCLLGPPGVGKTSLGQSMARAMQRPFVRASLGGVRDEAEIRGHRRTYVGAMPGRIIQALRRAGTRNPVFMLDEVDKLAMGYQGDPAAALLEVLDPAQNSSFTDTYLDVPFDLSQVFFVCTANQPDTIPAPLLDRMEIIELTSYTEAEKREIARRHLLPRLTEDHGLPPDAIEFDDDTLARLIRGWTREAGVRQLERRLAACCRKVARERLQGRTEPVRVTPELLAEWLGPPRADDTGIEEDRSTGAATGLAWTPVGGEVLSVEAASVPGSGKLTLTGQLGDVMQESARAAITCARLRASSLGLPEDYFARHDLHLHVPAGAVPKDGPSAGVTMTTALVSAATRRPVNRRWAMTGEITLRGLVLPVGGIKEKVLAADRAGLDGVLLPRRNERDMADIPDEVRSRRRLEFVDTIDQVLDRVLEPAEDRVLVAPG
ncbi:MAG: ATP-dependent protease La [Chloroflexi bacterium]|nr:ATP-dependent protease La [Chloroflexota bacterium]